MSRAAEIRLAAVVKGCSDGMLWYANRIGEVFELYAPYTGGAVNSSDGWRVWTNPGVNFIRLRDAEITPLRDGERIYPEPLPPAPTVEVDDSFGVCEGLPEARWLCRGVDVVTAVRQNPKGYVHTCECGKAPVKRLEEFSTCECGQTTTGHWTEGVRGNG